MNEHCRGCIRYLKSCSGMTKAVCEKHKLRIPRTNADIIRAMSDEELAELISFVFATGAQRIRSSQFWRDWLKKEVEENK